MTDHSAYERFSLPSQISDTPDEQGEAAPEQTPEPAQAQVADPLVEHGYYQWIPLAPGEEPPPGDDEEHGDAAQVGGGEPDIYRSPSGQQVALTPERMADFLESLQTMGNVSIACARAGVVRQTAYRARSRSPGFARAWDAALVAARTVAESELAERAINGVEEAVFYHGEEVARRRRYDSRLLLAHLGRLDKAAERLDVAATLPLLDDQIAALREGRAPEEAMPAQVAPEQLRQAQDERDFVADPRAETEAAEEREALAELRAKYSGQDSVTPVTPCPATPCPDCGGFCEDAKADPRQKLTSDDCQWLGNRLERMEFARPRGAPEPSEMGRGDPDGEIEAFQLAAFEAGEKEWWTLLPPDYETEEEWDW